MCHCSVTLLSLFLLFFFNDTATTEIYTLSLHDALPISSLIFENSGEISATTWLEVNANHVVNPGILSGDINARVRILAEHGFADLSRGAVRTGDLPQPDCTSVSNLFFGPFFFGLLDPEVIEDYNFINFGISGVVLSNRLNIPVPLFLPSLNTQFAPPNPIAPPAQYAALVSARAKTM